MQLHALRNLGPKSASKLEAIGVNTLDQLRELGAVETFIALKTQFPESTTLNFLYAIEGALENQDWRNIAAGRKGTLLNELEARLDVIEQLNL